MVKADQQGTWRVLSLVAPKVLPGQTGLTPQAWLRPYRALLPDKGGPRREFSCWLDLLNALLERRAISLAFVVSSHDTRCKSCCTLVHKSGQRMRMFVATTGALLLLEHSVGFPLNRKG